MSQHKLLQLIDQAKPNLQPLNTHYMAQFSVAERQDYATMLAAVITGTGTVTEAQSRLFGMLLTSMELDRDVASYYKLAMDLDENKLCEFVVSFRDSNKSKSFIFDSSILMFLINVNNTELLNQLSSVMLINNKDVMVLLDNVKNNTVSIDNACYIDEKELLTVINGIHSPERNVEYVYSDINEKVKIDIEDGSVFNKIIISSSFNKDELIKKIAPSRINVKGLEYNSYSPKTIYNPFNNKSERLMLQVSKNINIYVKELYPEYLCAWSELFGGK